MRLKPQAEFSVLRTNSKMIDIVYSISRGTQSCLKDAGWVNCWTGQLPGCFP